MKKALFIFSFFFYANSFSQSNFKKFCKLSPPIKTWVILHPFKAKKTLKISLDVRYIADSIAKTTLLDGDRSGGQVDAFRHAYWMARLKQKIGHSAAKSLGKAHERENYLTYKKKKLEDGVIPDKISSEMDLFNNDVGLSLTVKGSKVSRKALIFRVVNTILQGKMKVLKKDEKGNFLTCEGKIIDAINLKGKWINNKCLVDSK